MRPWKAVREFIGMREDVASEHICRIVLSFNNIVPAHSNTHTHSRVHGELVFDANDPG